MVDNTMPVNLYSEFPGDQEDPLHLRPGNTWKREELRDRLDKERKMLAGKSGAEKAKILKSLQLQSEERLRMGYVLENRQLRHDEQLASLKIEESRNVQNVLNKVLNTD